jgi:translation initiation factor IF-3
VLNRGIIKYINIKKYNVNNFIRAEKVLVIDEQGKNLGILPTSEAIKISLDKNLDLVEINPKAEPPVARVCDFGKFLYQQKKEERKQKVKQKKDELKKIKLTFNMGQHDLDVKMKQTEKFLKDNSKIQIEVFLKGRQKTKKDLAQQKLRNFLENISEEFRIVSEMKITPRNVMVVIGK